jgi:uncharacterized protein
MLSQSLDIQRKTSQSHLSQYVIVVPSLDHPKKSVLVHGYTGALDLVDADLAESLISSDFHGALEQLSLEERMHLNARGYLTEMPEDEEKAHVNRLVESVYAYYRNSLSVLIAPNLDCSLRCRYCFQRGMQNEITKNPSSPLASVISRQQIDKIFDVLETKKNDQSVRLNDNITLYGGEALQQANLDAVSYIIERGQKLGITFSAISNGYELDLYRHLLGPNAIRKIQITVDGPRAVHDKMRMARGGEPTFDKIIQNISSALGTGCEISISMNFDEENYRSLPELITYFKDLGWLEREDVVVHGNQIFNLKTSSTAFQEDYEALQEVRQFAAQNHVLLSNSTTKIQNLFLKRLADSDPLSLKPVYCSANTGMYIFGPDGKIYTCWEAVGDGLSCVGSYDPEFKIDSDNLSRWHDRVASRIDACHSCEYLMFCGGGCTINAYRKEGKFLAPYCDSFDSKFKDLIQKVVSEAYMDYLGDDFSLGGSDNPSNTRLIALNKALTISQSTVLSDDIIAFMVGASKETGSEKLKGGENWLCNFH